MVVEIDSFVTGHHVLKNIWTPRVGEVLPGKILQSRKTCLLLVSIDMEHLWGMFHVKKRTGCSQQLRSEGRIDVMVTGARCMEY